MERDHPLTTAFFQTEQGNQPCRDFILGLSRDDKREVGAKIFEVQKGFPLGLPLDFAAWFCKKISKNPSEGT